MTSGLRRARPWVAVVTLAVIACAGSFWVGAGVTSPWEQARENAATPVVASASVVEMLLDEESAHLADLSAFIRKPISLSAEPTMNPEQYDIVLL